MKTLIANKKTRNPVFQVLLLDNDSNQDVEVQEAQEVNFFQVKEHLKKGGSVFITSKDTQKIIYPKTKAQLNYNKSRRNYGFLFRKQLRTS